MTDKINIKTIQERLGVPITGAFVEGELKVEPVEKEKRAVYWSESQFGDICDKLIAHINSRRTSKAVADKKPAKPKGDTTASGDAAPFSFGDDAPAAQDTGFTFGDVTPVAEDTGFSFGDEAPAADDTGFSFE